MAELKILERLEKAYGEGLSKEMLEELFEELEKDDAPRSKAREQCFKELAKDPKNCRCRLFLAKLFYIDEFSEFCVRELIELQKYSSLESVTRLLDSFGNFGKAFVPAPVVEDLPEEEQEATDSASDSSDSEKEPEKKAKKEETPAKEDKSDEKNVAELDVKKTYSSSRRNCFGKKSSTN